MFISTRRNFLMNEKKKGMSDIAVIGMALFATFFGAGNLIFPPYLGINAGSEWFKGFFCFFIADVGVALAAIFAMIKTGDISINGLTGRLGKLPSFIMNSLIVLCIGPFLAIPRTAATTYEMGVMPIFPFINSWVFGAIFFGLVLLFTVRPSGVIDIIGKFFTPALVACLLALIVIGYMHPIGNVVTTTNFDTLKEGILAGYQTMDVLVSIVFIITIVSAAHSKGYTETKSTIKIITQSSFFAAIALFIVYGGLCFLGATTSAGGFENYNQSTLLVAITQALIGNYGILILSIIVFLPA
ncbi:MAG: branched-chain amino acid transport system II carrier protein [Clostridia bacterium]|nr:branched-chain amino acid transport system II carrier protein [Clostridia bacterium]